MQSGKWRKSNVEQTRDRSGALRDHSRPFYKACHSTIRFFVRTKHFSIKDKIYKKRKKKNTRPRSWAKSMNIGPIVRRSSRSAEYCVSRSQWPRIFPLSPNHLQLMLSLNNSRKTQLRPVKGAIHVRPRGHSHSGLWSTLISLIVIWPTPGRGGVRYEAAGRSWLESPCEPSTVLETRRRWATDNLKEREIDR